MTACYPSLTANSIVGSGRGPEYRLIQDGAKGSWYVIRADEVPVFYRWCDAMAGRGEHVPGDFAPTPVSGPGSVTFREWRVMGGREM